MLTDNIGRGERPPLWHYNQLHLSMYNMLSKHALGQYDSVQNNFVQLSSNFCVKIAT